MPYPLSRPTEAAKLTEENINILLLQEKIEVKTQGSSIQDVRLSIRRRVEEDLIVIIPPGTYFVSANISSQDMVSRRPERISLSDDNWYDVSILAACANISRDVPGVSESFEIYANSNNFELDQLMVVLPEAELPYEIEQAATWIVTDDANYADLGILVAGGSRVIHEMEVARALQLLDLAGIDVTKHSIWLDRETIIAGLDEESLKTWLREREDMGALPLPEIGEPDPAKLAKFSWPLFDMAFSPDGSTLAATYCVSQEDRGCTDDGGVVLFDVYTREEIRRIEGHSNVPRDVTWSPDGSMIASEACREINPGLGCVAAEVFLWDVQTGEKVGDMEEVRDEPFNLTFNPNGTRLAASLCLKPGDRSAYSGACEEGGVVVWEISSGRLTNTFGNLDSWSNFYPAPNGEIFATDQSGGVLLKDLESGELVRAIEGIQAIWVLAWSQDSNYLVTSTYGPLPEVLVWDATNGKQLAEVILTTLGPVAEMRGIAWAPDGEVLYIAYCGILDEQIYDCVAGGLARVNLGEILRHEPSEMPVRIEAEFMDIAVDAWSISISPRGDLLAVLDDNSNLSFFGLDETIPSEK
jgi:WD40 repeat protein